VRYLELWLDHPKVGCGYRRFIDLTKPKAKQATLFYWPTLTKITVPLADLRGAKEIVLSRAEERALLKRVRAQLKHYKRLGLAVDRAKKTVKTTLAAG
jgi:hypothetical protein